MGVFEHEFVVKNGDLPRAMKVGMVSDTVLPSLLPQFISKIDRIQGDGGAGTVKVVTVNPAMTGGEVITITQHTTVHDDATGTIVWEETDPRFSKVLHTLKISAVGTDIHLNWKLDYEPVDPATPPPEDIKMITLEVCNALKNHLETNPSWPEHHTRYNVDAMLYLQLAGVH